MTSGPRALGSASHRFKPTVLCAAVPTACVPQWFLSILKCSTSLLNTQAPPIIVVMAEKMIAETLRDLIQCVQAARDGTPGQSLFAMQCDLVLDRAAQL